jgi:CRP-like cAMP-binding protein
MLTARRELKQRVARLKHIPLVAGCTFGQLTRIDRLGTQVEVRAGRTLTREGAFGRECFVVIDGTALAERAGRPIGRIGPGSIAGEMALLDHEPRNATVVAETPMQVLVLTDREFAALLDVAPCVESAVGQVIAERRAALTS